jgi:hypothetical protein
LAHFCRNRGVKFAFPRAVSETVDWVKQALDVAKNFKPLTEDQVTALLKKTEQAAAKGKHERFKTATEYDSTAKHPEYLG